MDKPKVTFLLLTYNQERWVKEAVEAALAQDYEPLEIVISDDCSTDRTWDVVQEIIARYDGPHIVKPIRTERNLGLAGNLNHAVEASTGKLLVLASGDDVSLPNRVSRLVSAYTNSAQSHYSVYSRITIIDKDGRVRGSRPEYDVTPERLTPEWLGTRGTVLGSSHACTRSLFETFGPLPPSVTQEDFVLGFRAALLGRVEYVDEPLVKRRVHGQNMWNRMVTGGSKNRKLLEDRVRKTRMFRDNLDVNLTTVRRSQVSDSMRPSLDRAVERRISEVERDLAILQHGTISGTVSCAAQQVVEGRSISSAAIALLQKYFSHQYESSRMYVHYLKRVLHGHLGR